MKHSIAVVTGASSGLGAGLARALAEAGARVAVVGRRRERLTTLAHEIGGAPVVCDLADTQQVSLVVPQVVDTLGPPEILVNAAGDMFTYGDDVPELIDYAGGGSAKEWTPTIDSALQLEFDNVVPGHGPLVKKADMRKFRDSTVRFRNRVHELVTQKKSRADIENVMRSEFHWADLHVMLSLDGAIAEMQ